MHSKMLKDFIFNYTFNFSPAIVFLNVYHFQFSALRLVTVNGTRDTPDPVSPRTSFSAAVYTMLLKHD